MMQVKDTFNVSDSEWDVAEEEIDKRLEAGEQLSILYAACSNEIFYRQKLSDDTESNREAKQHLRVMMCCLAIRIADEYMEEHGWKTNENNRFIRED